MKNEKDCLGCRIIGSAGGIGTGTYLFYEIKRANTKSHIASLTLLGSICFTAGIYRGFIMD
jgi:hypothetical protein